MMSERINRFFVRQKKCQNTKEARGIVMNLRSLCLVNNASSATPSSLRNVMSYEQHINLYVNTFFSVSSAKAPYEMTSQESTTRVTTIAATITTTEVEELSFNTSVIREDDFDASTTSISRTTRLITTAANYETESILGESTSSSSTNVTPPSPRTIKAVRETNIDSAKSTGDKDDDYLRQLYCMMLSMLKESREVLLLLQDNSCERVDRGNDWNPILYFEDTVSKAAAKIFFSRRLNASYSEKVGGMSLEIIPIRSKSADGGSIQSLKMPIEDSCVECDELEIDHSDMYEFDKVIVGARFERSVLEGLGVYDSPLETTLDKSSLEYTSYVSPGTSVLSVTLFKNTNDEGVHAVSKPTKINFNLDKDDSLADIVMSGTRSRFSKLKRKCVFMKPNGKWSDKGCTASSEKATFSMQCHCNHTTAFAVMVSLDAIKIPDWLETVLVIVEIIGIIFLLSTLAMLLYLRQTLKKGRIITQLHLCLALLLMHISMVCAYYATSIDGLCVTLAAFSHFFMVSSAMWMLNEGIVLYKKTGSGALNFDIHKFKKWLILLGWVVPFLYAAICLAIGMSLGVYLDTTIEYDDLRSRNLLDRTTKDVKKYRMCWLGTRNYMVVAAIAPVAITLLLATCILLWVTKIIWSMSKQALDMMPSGVKKRRESIKSTARAVALLIPVLGLPWILAFFVNIEGAEVVFTAINGITNGLQGFVLFIIYIIINRETRTSMKRKLTRSFSSSQAHSLSAIPSGVSHKFRDSASHNGGGDKLPTRQTSPPKEASAIAKV